MDHGGSGHGGMDMPMCSMNMIWNYDTTNICILTSSWRITTPFSLYLSLTFIAFISILYEYLRLYIRQFDARLARNNPSNSLGIHRRRTSLLPTSTSSSSSGSERRGVGTSKRRAATVGREDNGGRNGWVKELETSKKVQLWRSGLYASSVGISFLLMLIGMTFNAFVVGAIVIGAGMGHYWFNRDLKTAATLGEDDAGLGCHL
ncbi:hypothetical protein NDA14_000370 [Ustilago hordei]|nr:hypothetical protein NDA14_000370 [Ustilago hordei]UTT91624.1 hypothetical protein NDA17_003897 [Ustilago hordei]